MRGCPVVSLQSTVVSQQVVSLHNEVDLRRSCKVVSLHQEVETASKFAGVHIFKVARTSFLTWGVHCARIPLHFVRER